MLSEKAWKDGMGRLSACYPAANKNLSADDIAVRDLAYHDAIAPLFGNADERKERPRLLREEAWPIAVRDVTRTWEFPFALPPPSDLIEAARAADQRIAPNQRLPTEDEKRQSRLDAERGMAMIEAKLAASGAKLLPHQLSEARSMKALPVASEPIMFTDEQLARAREKSAELRAKHPEWFVDQPAQPAQEA